MRPAPDSHHHSPRRGIATIWVVVAIPAITTLMVVVLDVANVWLAKSELKNAMDSAALSGVKTWGEGGTTLAARQAADRASSTNRVLGTSLTLNTAEGGCTNNNVSSTGEIVLGAVTDSGSALAFNCNTVPACVVGAISATFEVNTDPIAPDVGTADTLTRPYSFRITNFTGPGGSVLSSVTINLAPMTVQNTSGGPVVADNGFFDFRPQPPTADNQAGSVFGVGTTLLNNTFTTFSSTGGAAVSSLSATVNSQPTSLQVNLSGFDPGDTLFFGADTDRVGPDNGNNGQDVADFGGHFGSGYVDSGNRTTVNGALVTFVISGQPFSGTLTSVDEDTSTVTVNGNLTGGSPFAIRTRKTVAVTSLANSLFGFPVGPFQVTAESYARFPCTSGPPQLFRVDMYGCVCP